MKLDEYPHSLITPEKASELEDVPFTSWLLGNLRSQGVLEGEKISPRQYMLTVASLKKYINALRTAEILPVK